MNILKGGLIFLLGAAAGSVVTYFLTSDKKEDRKKDISFKDADHMSEEDLKEYYLEGLRDLGFGIEERFVDEGSGEKVNPVEGDEYWETEDVALRDQHKRVRNEGRLLIRDS